MSTPWSPARVLVVCTGNLARSPYAAAAIYHEWNGYLVPSLDVTSAGLSAHTGSPAAPEMAAVARKRGYRLDEHRSRRLDRDLLRTADLVITMTAAQRAEVQRLLPASIPRTFSLAEFAMLLGSADMTAPVSVPDAAVTAHRRRPYCVGDGSAADVEDPYGRPLDRFVKAARHIDRLVDGVVRSVTRRPSRR
jgi:protein-tyrosine phosphatase